MAFVMLCRVLLAGVFLLSGLAKLFDLRGSQEAARNFGVPPPLAVPAGTLIPVVELAVGGALLLWDPFARWGALAALTLLLVFAAAIIANLVRGRTPDCHCFGQLHSTPVGWATVVRNLALAALAGFILWQSWESPGPSVLESLSGWAVNEPVLLGVGGIAVTLFVLGGWLMYNLLKQHGRVLMQLDSLASRLAALERGPAEFGRVGAPESFRRNVNGGILSRPMAPRFSLVDLLGETVSLDSLRAARKADPVGVR